MGPLGRAPTGDASAAGTPRWAPSPAPSPLGLAAAPPGPGLVWTLALALGGWCRGPGDNWVGFGGAGQDPQGPCIRGPCTWTPRLLEKVLWHEGPGRWALSHFKADSFRGLSAGPAGTVTSRAAACGLGRTGPARSATEPRVPVCPSGTWVSGRLWGAFPGAPSQEARAPAGLVGPEATPRQGPQSLGPDSPQAVVPPTRRWTPGSLCGLRHPSWTLGGVSLRPHPSGGGGPPSLTRYSRSGGPGVDPKPHTVTACSKPQGAHLPPPRPLLTPLTLLAATGGRRPGPLLPSPQPLAP